MMNKKSRSIAAIYAIVAFVYAIAFLIIPFAKTGASYASFAFTLASLALSLFSLKRVLGGEDDVKSKFYGFPILRIVILYPIFQLALGVVICIVAAFLAIPSWVAIVLSLILMGVFAIGLIATDNVRDIIEEAEAEFESVTKTSKVFKLSVSSAMDLCNNDEVKKELEKLSESFRFSDPVSNEATEEIENTITEKLDSLKINIRTLQTRAAIDEINEIRILLNERNRICKANK